MCFLKCVHHAKHVLFLIKHIEHVLFQVFVARIHANHELCSCSAANRGNNDMKK